MAASSALPGWDSFLLAIPFLAILAMAMFGLDERAARPRRSRHRRFCCRAGGNSPSCFSDPDGTPWPEARLHRVEASLIPLGGPHPHDTAPSADPGRVTVIRGYILENE